MGNLLKKSIKATFVLLLVLTVALIFVHQIRFAAGVLVSCAWSMINIFLLIKILEISLLHKSKEKLLLILLIKFPVLYLLGFLILTSKLFPAYSLIAGLGLFLLTAGVISLLPKRT